MVKGWHRTTWIEIDQEAIRSNIKAQQKILPKKTKIWAVLKANAYGHGILEVAKIARSAGIKGFCVAILDEALVLREAGFTEEQILVFGAVPPEHADLAAQKKIALTVFDPYWLDRLPSLTEKLSLHIKVDSGMGRLGFYKIERINEAVQKLAADSMLLWEGIYTHFATADDKDSRYYEKQLSFFRGILRQLSNLPAYVHVANSSSALLHDQTGFNVVRLGIAMYGLTPATDLLPRLPFELKPALSLHTNIVQVKRINSGDSIGYGATYKAQNSEWIATLPIGYADGWIRKYSGFKVLIDGEYAEIIGRICMDQLMIRLPRYFRVGTKVTFIGSSNGKQNTVDQAAEKIESINYEVVCLLSERIPRIYK